jgi:hypothetical protein
VKKREELGVIPLEFGQVSDSIDDGNLHADSLSHREIRLGARTALVGLAFVSYLTSFFRETFLVQIALGSTALDRAVLAYGMAAFVGNLYAIALGLVWIDGRRIPSICTRFGVFAVSGIVLLPIWPVAGSCVLLASFVAGFEFHRQRSAFVNRQAGALIGAIIAPTVSVICWKISGVASLLPIVIGYSAGFLVQFAVVARLSRAAKPNRPSVGQRANQAVGVIWPLIFAAVSLLNSLVDRLILPFAANGWVGAAAYAQNLATAALLIVVGPLSGEAVAGRIRSQPSSRVLAAAVLGTGIAMCLTPIFLPLLVSSGAVSGNNYRHVEQLVILYLAAVPGGGYWTFRARALQVSSHTWRPAGLVAVAMLLVHVAISGAAMASGHPLGVPAGWVASLYLGAALMSPSLFARISGSDDKGQSSAESQLGAGRASVGNETGAGVRSLECDLPNRAFSGEASREGAWQTPSSSEICSGGEVRQKHAQNSS